MTSRGYQDFGNPEQLIEQGFTNADGTLTIEVEARIRDHTRFLV